MPVKFSPNGNMYAETAANNNLRTLVDLEGINSITSYANGLIGKKGQGEDVNRARRIEYFYDQMLLDTIKLGSENNVFLKYCKVKTVPNGNEKFLLRRWGGLTEHKFPLAEGIPPKSDHMSSESFEGTYQQFGRYMEFTDRVDFNLIDDVITHYSIELGDVAVRTAERLCREELIANAGENYPKGKTFESLVIGDTVGIADYRLQALKFQRRLVKPINGSYHIICSPEHIYDLVNDPLVDTYMQYTNTAEPYMTGKPVNLFNLTFEETMLDDYAYGYTEMSNPGEFEYVNNNVLSHKLRLLVVQANGTYAYFNAVEGTTTGIADGIATVKRTVGETYLKDGSWIPGKVTWDIAGLLEAAVTTTTTGEGDNATTSTADGASVTATDKDGHEISNFKLYPNSEIYQLPVHRSFMFGDEFIYKTGIDGRMNAKFYVKEKGSAGVLDPIDQRQSVGFKIDTLGFNTVRPEAMVQFIFVPTQALATYKEVIDELNIHYNTGGYSSASITNSEPDANSKPVGGKVTDIYDGR